MTRATGTLHVNYLKAASVEAFEVLGALLAIHFPSLTARYPRRRLEKSILGKREKK